ncbi:MAG: hypothetical protein IH855_06010 [Bacteroidetes bacterium]|nr:hypothetical protein [Bacteroidota bacterium]
MAPRKPSQAEQRRADLKDEFWPGERAWQSFREKGYFSAPRTLPLVMVAIDLKNLSGNKRPSKVYVELLSNHIGQGIVELVPVEDHAFAAGYTGSRAVRTWSERMKLLETLGFIKTKEKGNRRFGYVLLRHPTIVMSELHDDGKIPDSLWNALKAKQIDARELTLVQIREGEG